MSDTKTLKRSMLAMLAVAAIPIGSASADTRSPCTGHGANPPYLEKINSDGSSTLRGVGYISGCPKVRDKTSDNVTIVVSLQHMEEGVWVDKVSATFRNGWNRYTRTARQAGGSLRAVCETGDWRIHVTGGDGWEPTEWNSTPATFVPGDSGVCGSYGGGD